jgi:hypothetical protein
MTAALKSGQMSLEAAYAIVNEHQRMMGQEADRNLITAALKDFTLIAKDKAQIEKKHLNKDHDDFEDIKDIVDNLELRDKPEMKKLKAGGADVTLSFQKKDNTKGVQDDEVEATVKPDSEIVGKVLESAGFKSVGNGVYAIYRVDLDSAKKAFEAAFGKQGQEAVGVSIVDKGENTYVLQHVAPITASPTFDKWLDTFISEKGIDLEETFTVEGPSGENIIPYGVIVEHMKIAGPAEQAKLKDKIVYLDFKNADIKDFFRHLGQAIAAKKKVKAAKEVAAMEGVGFSGDEEVEIFTPSSKVKANITRLSSGRWRDTNGNSYATAKQAAEAEAHLYCDQQIDQESQEYKEQYQSALAEILEGAESSRKEHEGFSGDYPKKLSNGRWQDQNGNSYDSRSEAARAQKANFGAGLQATIESLAPAEGDSPEALAKKVHSMGVLEARLARENHSLVRHVAIAVGMVGSQKMERLWPTASRVQILAKAQNSLDKVKASMAKATSLTMVHGASEGAVPAWCVLKTVMPLKGAKFGSPLFALLKVESERAMPAVLGFGARMTAALTSGLKAAVAYGIGTSDQALTVKARFDDFIRMAASETQKPGSFGPAKVEASASKFVESLEVLAKAEMEAKFSMSVLATVDSVFGKHAPSFAARRLRLPAGALEQICGTDVKATLTTFADNTLDHLRKNEKASAVCVRATVKTSTDAQALADSVRVLARSASNFPGSLRPEALKLTMAAAKNAKGLLELERGQATGRAVMAAWTKVFDTDPSASVPTLARLVASAVKANHTVVLTTGLRLQAAGGMWPWTSQNSGDLENWPQFIEARSDQELEKIATEWEARLPKAVGTTAKMNIESNVRRLKSVLDARKQARGCYASLVGAPDPLGAYWLLKAASGQVLMRVPLRRILGTKRTEIALKWATSVEYGQKLAATASTFGIKALEASMAPKAVQVKAEEVSQKQVYEERLKKTGDSRKAAEETLDIMSNGAFAAIGEPQRSEIINKFLVKMGVEAKRKLKAGQFEDIAFNPPTPRIKKEQPSFEHTPAVKEKCHGCGKELNKFDPEFGLVENFCSTDCARDVDPRNSGPGKNSHSRFKADQRSNWKEGLDEGQIQFIERWNKHNSPEETAKRNAHVETPERTEVDESGQGDTWADYFFAQGEEADEYIAIYDEEGAAGLIDYLNSAGVEEGDTYTGPGTPWGNDDRLEEYQDFMISVNRGLPYIGVNVKVKDEGVKGGKKVKAKDDELGVVPFDRKLKLIQDKNIDALEAEIKGQRGAFTEVEKDAILTIADGLDKEALVLLDQWKADKTKRDALKKSTEIGKQVFRWRRLLDLNGSLKSNWRMKGGVKDKDLALTPWQKEHPGEFVIPEHMRKRYKGLKPEEGIRKAKPKSEGVKSNWRMKSSKIKKGSREDLIEDLKHTLDWFNDEGNVDEAAKVEAFLAVVEKNKDYPLDKMAAKGHQFADILMNASKRVKANKIKAGDEFVEITVRHGGADETLFTEIVNQGIDSHLEGFTQSKFSHTPERLVMNFHVSELPILVRRLVEVWEETDNESAFSWAGDIQDLPEYTGKKDPNLSGAKKINAGRPGYFEATDEEVEILDGPKAVSEFKTSHPAEFEAFIKDGMNLQHGATEADQAYLVKHEDGTTSIIGVGDVFEGGREVEAVKVKAEEEVEEQPEETEGDIVVEYNGCGSMEENDGRGGGYFRVTAEFALEGAGAENQADIPVEVLDRIKKALLGKKVEAGADGYDDLDIESGGGGYFEVNDYSDYRRSEIEEGVQSTLENNMDSVIIDALEKEFGKEFDGSTIRIKKGA